MSEGGDEEETKARRRRYFTYDELVQQIMCDPWQTFPQRGLAYQMKLQDAEKEALVTERYDIQDAIAAIELGLAWRKVAISYLFSCVHHRGHERVVNDARRRLIQQGKVGRKDLLAVWHFTSFFKKASMQGVMMHMCIPLSCPRRPKTPWLNKDMLMAVWRSLLPK